MESVMRVYKYFDFICCENDVNKAIVRYTCDKDLWDKFNRYISISVTEHDFKSYCKIFKCIKLLEKNYPNSEYIFKAYKKLKFHEVKYPIFKRIKHSYCE